MRTTTSSITEEDKSFVETWENIAQGSWGILRLDPRGDIRDELISGRRNFMITTEERVITQDRIARKELDPFLNGSFRPVVVPDSVTIQSNPNALADEEIVNILKSSDLAWQEWMTTIDSVATLRRMLDIAEEQEVSLKRYRQMEARLVEVRPLNRISSNDPHLQKFLENRDTDAPPSGAGANPRRGQGGRSSDYR